jgi:hypothetical protein
MQLPHTPRANAPRLAIAALSLGLAATAVLVPLLDRALAAREGREALDAAERAVRVACRAGLRPERLTCAGLEGASLLRTRDDRPLASWGNVGGCGVGGGAASSTAGGAKWIGRNVTGGRVDLQCMGSETFLPSAGYFTAVNMRFATRVVPKWTFGLNVPILYKRRDVDVLGQQKTATLPGFGDLGVEVSRKLGITGADLVTLMLSAPTGAYDAQRQGIVLPQQVQLGSGVLGATGLYEHTFDRDWGLIVVGGSFTYSGWTNGIGDYRSPSVAGYGYFGFTLGPFVPSVGATLVGKFQHDRERGRDLDDAFFLTVLHGGVEWSSDYVALLLAVTAPFSYKRSEGVSVTLGVSTSLF